MECAMKKLIAIVRLVREVTMMCIALFKVVEVIAEIVGKVANWGNPCTKTTNFLFGSETSSFSYPTRIQFAKEKKFSVFLNRT